MILRELAAALGCAVRGDDGVEVLRVAGIDEAGPGDITFVANPRYASRLHDSQASAFIVSLDFETPRPSVLSRNPYLTYARAVGLLHPEALPGPGIHPSAQVHPTAVLGSGVHVGALDAMAGLPFRVLAIPGLVEGGYPGVFRPDPFLLDSERLALRHPEGGFGSAPEGSLVVRSSAPVRVPVSRKPSQLDLFSEAASPASPAPSLVSAAAPSPVSSLPGQGALPTTQDRLVEARRLFHRAVSQASERLILSYPRVDARSGRERLPSLFFAAAAATLAGRPVAGAELDGLVTEDDPLQLPLDHAVDAGERDRFRVRREDTAATAIAAGSPFFQKSRLASQARWSGRLTRYDGLVLDDASELGPQLDPLLARRSRVV
jgi:hypothetical protein